MTSQHTLARDEESNKDKLRILQQQIQELQEKVSLLEGENENLKSKLELKKRNQTKPEGPQSLPDQNTLTASYRRLTPEQEQSYDKSEGAQCLREQHGSTCKGSCKPRVVPKSRKKYKKTSSAANMEGELYEIMMATLIYSRCQSRGRNFLLAANMEAALPLDDIVLSLENNTVFIQLKHFTAKGKTIYDSMFLQLVSDFSLMKYFKAYLNIKKNWNKNPDLRSCGDFSNAAFVLYTNARMAENVATETAASYCNKTSDWQRMISTGGKCVQVSRKSHPHFYQFFESLPKDREILVSSRDGENEEELLDIVRRLQNFNAKTAPNAAERQKLLKDMVSMEQLSEYENFLSRLWIFTGQMNCQKLHTCIKKELCDLWNSCHMKTDSISLQFMTRMQTWWREESYFLNGNTEFWYEMITSLAENISKEKIKEFEGLGIKFDKSELNKVRRIIEGGQDLVRIVSVNSIMMTVLKVYQALGSCVLVDVAMLQERATEIMLLWRWCTVLVVVVDTKENEDTLPKAVPGRTLVTVSKDISNETCDCKDNFCIEQLDGCSRAQVLSLPVMFQGSESTLWELLGTDSKLNVAVNGDLILEMLKGKKVCIGNELPELPEFYVSRALIHKCAVKPSILNAQENATLAVSGIDEDNLIRIKPNEETAATSNKVTVLTIQDEEHFTRVKTQHQNIHWLHFENDVLYWKKSEGDISLIKKFLEETNSFVYKNVSTVDDIGNNVVVLSAEPGMGKSTLLINIARNTKSSKDSALVLRINLIDCINEIQNLPLELNVEHVYSFLLNVTHTLELAGVFSARLFNMDNVYLFFDGYDEISPDYSDKVSQILKLIKDNNPRKLLVTTRPGMRQALEQNLSTLVCTLEPFSVEDQENLLKKSWGSLSNKCSPEILQWFVSEIISIFSKSINEKHLLGIPLQTMMLAEIFADEFITLANTGEVALPDSLDPLYIFEQFVDRKFYIYWQKNGMDLSIPSFKENCKALKRDFLERHMLCAVIVINPFMELKDDASTKVHEIIKRIAEGREKTGIIMDIVNGVPVFVHRMFAEYLAALWFAENYKEYKSMIKTIHWDSTYAVVLDFFNRKLAKSCDLHMAVLNMDTNLVLSKMTENPELVNAVDEGGRSPLHLAILNCKDCSENSRACTIVKILLSIEVIDLKCDKVLGMNPAEYADKLEISWIQGILTARAEKAIKNVPNQVVNVLQPVRSVVPSEIRGLFDVLEWLRDNINKLD